MFSGSRDGTLTDSPPSPGRWQTLPTNAVHDSRLTVRVSLAGSGTGRGLGTIEIVARRSSNVPPQTSPMISVSSGSFSVEVAVIKPELPTLQVRMVERVMWPGSRTL